MNRTIKAIAAVVFIMVITFAGISICQNIGRGLRADATERNLYTLSPGTKAILARLRQPMTMKLYYAKTAALEGPDEIRYFNSYYYYVKALVEQYAAASDGMVKLEVVDPRPYSDEEVEALGYGLKRFPITEEENFFFGLVVQTQFGVEKSIPFFSPDRQKFVEYDISRLIDSAITRQKKRVGILSSLPVMGEDVSGYMAQMMQMQGREPQEPWTIVEQLKQRYEVSEVATDVEEITNVDILLVIHPKELPEKTLFAIDQFVLKGGRTIVCVDPFSFVDRPDPSAGQAAMFQHQPSSNLGPLLQTWGLRMPENTFAGDRGLALAASLRPQDRPENIIGFLQLVGECFNQDSPVTSQLGQVRLLFPGVLQKTGSAQDEQNPDVRRIPLITTTDRGNTWTIQNSFELMGGQFSRLWQRFNEGTEPVPMGYLISGKLRSSFPEGIDIVEEAEENEDSSEETDAEQQEDSENKQTTRHLSGLTESQGESAVMVFTDVDFISDSIAYSRSLFGTVVVGDNSALLTNAIDNLSGSDELISIRSRGKFERPFVVVNEIERQAEKETAEEEARINAKITGFQQELNNIVQKAKSDQQELVGTSILEKRKQLEFEIRRAQHELRRVKMQKREKIEAMKDRLRNFCTLPGPAVILAIAVMLRIRRGVKHRRYISHASDA